MVSPFQLQLLLWIVVFVSAGQLSLIARYLLWPRLSRITHCPWCWKDAGIADRFPEPWTSTICPYHDRLMRAQSAARRLARGQAVALTKPALPVLQAEEVQV